ncbi:MAG: orotidine-5'-phosphate decarboxylase [Solirubrobacteraceae bacterium]|nr:orotidine-5'-phosphate decarboxylase [Solirubrobacteraceae bacterium]
MNASERIIVALDVDTEAEARAIVDALGDMAPIYKVGLQWLTTAGPAPMRELIAAGKQVFLDLKLFEIPNSVAAAVRAAGRQGVAMVTVHASAGSAILHTAVDAARPWPALKVLALTVVTSLGDADLREVGIEAGVDVQVLRLARLAEAAGCHGVIASPREVAMLRAVLDPRMLIVTPGIQFVGDAAAAPGRADTPAHAIGAGASHVVLGRTITQAADPRAVFVAVRDEVERAWRNAPRNN